jgi:pSer/pThr/pTyr-binding forkhead associated (FHA) protein
MALLEMGGRKFTIPVGDAFLGSDAGCAVHLTGAGALPRHAKLKGLLDGQVVIAKAVPEAEVLINGVRLGAEPTPLLHGDKVELAGQELTFVDERRSGSTQYVQAMSVPQAMAQAKAGAKATSNTGGRVVSLTDGREYAIAGASLVFGRDATCDVVVAGKDVSRRHAEIVQTPKGYLVVDSSTNGTFVNEQRVEGQRLLARTDVIRIGDENFRFYADAAPNPQPGPAASTPPAAPQVESAAPGGAAGAGERLKNTVHGTAGVLGNFLVRAGALKGQRLVVKTPIVNIGRADYNDLVLPDESVSTSHAKLQRREGVWVLVDLDSTNGTFVDGERVQGETPIAPGTNVRFGDVALVFEPTDDAAGVAKGGSTRMIEVMKVAPAPPPAPKPAPVPPAKAPPKAAPVPATTKPKAPAPPTKRPTGKAVAEQKKKGKGCGGSAAVFVLAAIGVAYWVLV